jgi:hypothetical protein
MGMRDVAAEAVRFSADDLAIVEAAKRKLGCRSASEVLPMGLRSLVREQGLVVNERREAGNGSEKAERQASPRCANTRGRGRNSKGHST